MTQEYRHTPVMCKEAIKGLNLQNGSIALDCTLGGAGHSIQIAKDIAPDGILIGFDQDDAALQSAFKRLQSISLKTAPVLLKGNFANMDELLLGAEVPYVNAILFDLGVSSPQFDFPERGFSYRTDAPLDMRMDQNSEALSAADVVNSYSEAELTRILKEYAQEKWAARIARFICDKRCKQPVNTTFELVEIIKAAIPVSARREGGHPAKRTFQALRIEVNKELEVLKTGLESAIRWLLPGGRIVVISYHSLEDRIVKDVFKKAANPCTCDPSLPVCVCGNVPILKILTRKPLLPSSEEIEQNPRSHSAKVRIAEKI